MTNYFHLSTKLRFIMYRKHILYFSRSLSPTDAQPFSCTQANVVSTTLTILSVR